MTAPLTAKPSHGKVLFVASNPTEIKFDFAEELHRIEAAGLAHPGGLSVIARWSVSLDQLRNHLRKVQHDVIHLLSPGVNPASNALLLSDERGHPQHVSVDELSGAFARLRTTTPRVVVLNTCHSRLHAEAIAAHVGCAVAMDGTIFDNEAISFAGEFYEALAAGGSVAAAFTQARDLVMQMNPEHADVPVLLPGHTDPGLIRIASQSKRSKLPEVQSVAASTVPATGKPSCVQIFCSYSHKDSKYRTELETFLANLRLQGMLNVWHDRLIKPGTDWAQEIDRNLDHANLILLLVSADFLASQYCMGIELKRALERHKVEGVRMIPILVRECDLEGAPFTGLQWLPTGSKPVKKWSDRDSAWTNVAKGIREAAKDLIASGSKLTR